MSDAALGSLYVVSAPSGAGKTSLVKALLESTPGLALSISHTTRPMRPGETDGVHYRFVDVPRFEAMIGQGAFLEHARVFDNLYGTSVEGVETQLATGDDVVLEIDWQGARQVRERIPGCVGIFILPPSRAALEQRLRGRGQDSEEVIARRMQDAISEMGHYAEYDYLIVNDDFDSALAELRSVMVGRRQRLARQQIHLAGLIADLLA